MPESKAAAASGLYGAVVRFFAGARYDADLIRHPALRSWTVGTFTREDAGALVAALIRFKSAERSEESAAEKAASWIGALRDAIDAQTEPGPATVLRGWNAKADAKIPEFAELTDAQLNVLLLIVCNEGCRRGFGNGWWT